MRIASICLGRVRADAALKYSGRLPRLPPLPPHRAGRPQRALLVWSPYLIL